MRAFRSRYGRGWDLDAEVSEVGGNEGEAKEQSNVSDDDGLLDLISGAGESYKLQEKNKADAIVMEEEQKKATAASSGKRGKMVKEKKED